MLTKLFTRAKLFAWVLILLSVLGLLFMPLFPWVTSVDEDAGTTEYASEAMVYGWVSMFYADFAGYSDFLSEGMRQGLDLAFGAVSPLFGLTDALQLMSWSLWLTILFAIIIIVGLALYKLEKRYETLSHLFLMMGGVSILFSLLILIGHIQFFMHLNALANPAKGVTMPYSISFDFSNAYFGYNYVPLLIGILLVIVSSMYLKLMIGPTMRYFKNRSKTTAAATPSPSTTKPSAQSSKAKTTKKTTTVKSKK